MLLYLLSNYPKAAFNRVPDAMVGDTELQVKLKRKSADFLGVRLGDSFAKSERLTKIMSKLASPQKPQEPALFA